jgi:large subunit ribosomal protein L31
MFNHVNHFMKPNIHPQYFTNATVTCACGASFTTGSTVKDLHTEICSACHPFYTGQQKLVDTAGVVDKFRKRIATASQIKSVVKTKKPRKARVKK